MIWLSRPPYLRWIAAAALVVGGVLVDCADRAMEEVPFAATDVPRGTALADAAIEWRSAPKGLLDAPKKLRGFTLVDVRAGDPITAAMVGDTDPVPDGWWSVPVELPEAARPGQAVRLVGVEPAFAVEGLVTDIGSTGSFGLSEPGLVAVPPAFATEVARAVASGRLVVLLG